MLYDAGEGEFLNSLLKKKTKNKEKGEIGLVEIQ